MAIRIWTEDDYPDAEPEYEPVHCVRCGRFCEDRDDRAGMCGKCYALATSPDPRDRTPPPPALLNPRSVMRNRERTRRLLATGEFTWPRPWEAA